jgi:hypothetical protein
MYKANILNILPTCPVVHSLLGMPLTSMCAISCLDRKLFLRPLRLSRTSSIYLVNWEITNLSTSICKASFIFVLNLPNLNSVERFYLEKPLQQNITAISPVGAKLFQLEGQTQTGMNKLKTDFRTYRNRLYKSYHYFSDYFQR